MWHTLYLSRQGRLKTRKLVESSYKKQSGLIAQIPILTDGEVYYQKIVNQRDSKHVIINLFKGRVKCYA